MFAVCAVFHTDELTCAFFRKALIIPKEAGASLYREYRTYKVKDYSLINRYELVGVSNLLPNRRGLIIYGYYILSTCRTLLRTQSLLLLASFKRNDN